MRSLKPSLRTHRAPAPKPLPLNTASEQRIAGRALQTRRLKLWTASPYCKGCGCLTDYPHGFELDHIQRLDQGGQDTEANCQILCAYTAPDGTRQGCHAAKTAEEVRNGAKKGKHE